MRTDTKDFRDRAEHWAELQDHVHHSPELGADLDAATHASPVILDPLCGVVWPAGVEPADIREAALALYPVWYTLAGAGALGLLALVVRWWVVGS